MALYRVDVATTLRTPARRKLSAEEDVTSSFGHHQPQRRRTKVARASRSARSDSPGSNS